MAGTFYPAPVEMPVTFDENIASVTMVISVGGSIQDTVTITESGTVDINGDNSTDYIQLTVTPKDGYKFASYEFDSDTIYYNEEVLPAWTATQSENMVTLRPHESVTYSTYPSITFTSAQIVEETPATRKFTKLNLGNTAASSGGRAFRKLSTVSVEETVTEYTISINSADNFYENGSYGTIKSGETKTITLTEHLPHTFTVFGATGEVKEVEGNEFLYTYEITISNPTGDVLISGSSEKPAPALIISFTINGVSYDAEEGMTFEQWIASEYNTGGFELCTGTVDGTACNLVHPTETDIRYFASKDDVIEADKAYTNAACFMHDVSDDPPELDPEL